MANKITDPFGTLNRNKLKNQISEGEIPTKTPKNILERVREKLRNRPESNKESLKWFREQIFKLGPGHGSGPHAARTSAASFKKELLKDTRLQQDDANEGLLYLFKYDPKYKATLPYYDKFPLVFPFEIYEDGFIGLNLHYLPYKERLVLFSKLMEFSNTKKMTLATKLRISWNIIKHMSPNTFKPCIKRYLNDHLQSKLIRINSKDWETAIFLPVEDFAKQPKTTVWKKSLEIAGKR